MSNEKTPWLFRVFRGFDILPSYVEIIMNHYKDPHLTTKIQRKVVSLQGELPERWRIRRTSGWLGQEESAVTWNSEKSLKISCINFFESTSWNALWKKYECTIYVMMLLCNSVLFVLLHKVALANGLLGRPGTIRVVEDLHQSRVGHHPGSNNSSPETPKMRFKILPTFSTWGIFEKKCENNSWNFLLQFLLPICSAQIIATSRVFSPQKGS